MAEGIAKSLGIAAESAGVLAAGVHPTAVAVMAEKGIDIASHRSRSVPELAGAFDVVVTLCDYARAVFADAPPARRRLHWPIEDPIVSAGTDNELAEFRRARDEIRALIEEHRADLL